MIIERLVLFHFLVCRTAHSLGTNGGEENTQNIRGLLNINKQGVEKPRNPSFDNDEVSNQYANKVCKDGEDCNRRQCKRETAECESPVSEAAANPPGKSLNIPMLEDSGPFCVKFNNSSNTEGFDACPGYYDNIFVVDSPSNTYGDDPINPLSGDTYLHVRDGSGGSLACGTGMDYTGDWYSFANTKCHELCFDVKLIYDACTSSNPKCTQNTTSLGYYIEVLPAIILQGGAPDYLRAVFRAYNFMTDGDGSSPGWRRICAPLAPLNSTGDLPSNEDGYWYMAAPNNILSGGAPVIGPPSDNTAWPTLLSDITAIQLPVDFTGNPAERVGYDNICMVERDCTDLCDPEPLCYWQYEWSCEDAKKEEWHSNFTDLVSPLATFPKHFCICKILNQCCADLCDIAEQEFMALLLNVASGQVSLDCGVIECDDCVHNVSSIISTVDDLLAVSSRSDYDCSKALHFLTGMNHDMILCDSPTDPDDPNPGCPQSEECEYNLGNCVPKADCIPSDTIGCEDHFCLEHEGCTCMMARPCNQSDSCKAKGGTCKKNCEPNSDLGIKCEDLCEDAIIPGQCMCEISECIQSEVCADNDGTCVRKEDCIPTDEVECDDDLCQGENCTCQKAGLPCIQTTPCQGQYGKCVKVCEESELIACLDICLQTDDVPNKCMCKVRKCKQTTQCEEVGGECIKKLAGEDCPPGYKCDDRYCIASEGCTCKIPIDSPPCTDINFQCSERDGECVKECNPVDGSVSCIPDLCRSEDATQACYCKVVNVPSPCVDVDDICRLKKGECVKECDPTADGSVLCIEDWCKSKNPDETCYCKVVTE
mmetsp:Transcript_17363/g.26317  ORF Transcript_17363/g.26317 Transcript_17363/m.26317 type:complete len:821 (-) Transcript_17363:2113-4575(-)